MAVRLRTTDAEHIDDLRVFFTANCGVHGMRSKFGAQLERVRDGTSGGGYRGPDDEMIEMLEPTGSMAQVKAVCMHCWPVVDAVPADAASALELGLSTYPSPAWTTYPARFLATSKAALREFERTADLWRKRLPGSKEGKRMAWTCEEFVQWCILRASQSDGKVHKTLVLEMIRQCAHRFNLALEQYKLAYNTVYNGLGRIDPRGRHRA